MGEEMKELVPQPVKTDSFGFEFLTTMTAIDPVNY
jgi:hypothetical protein